MGVWSRDYLRDEEARYGGGGGTWLSDTPVVRWIILLNGIIFFLQLILVIRPADGGFPILPIDDWFRMDIDAVLHGQVWRILSYSFLHDRGNLLHVVLNMLVLWFFGTSLERMYGSREFLAFYLLAAVVAALGYMALGIALDSRAPMVGASGAVMAAFMLYGMHFPRQIVYLYFIPIEIRWLIALYAAMDLIPLMRQMSGEPDMTGVAHSAHLAGLVFGWQYYSNGWRLIFTWDRLTAGFGRSWKRVTTHRHLKVYAPREEEIVDIDSEVDRILAKIHEQGSESLTDKERRTLTQASERYKKK